MEDIAQKGVDPSQKDTTQDGDPSQKDTAQDGDPSQKETVQKEVSQAQEEYDSANKLKILIAGKTGCGKSTLVNSLVGIESGSLAEEGEDADPCTAEVKEHKGKRNGVDVSVWDSPGFQDGSDQTEYLKQIRKKCAKRDLTIMCIKLGERFVCSQEDPNVATMVQLTNAFGKGFWNNTVIVLTFTNMLLFIPRWRNLSPAQVQQEFEKKIQQWTDRIRKALTEVVGLAKEVADKVKVIAAGHYTERDLPGIEFWLSALFFGCVAALQEYAKAAMIKLNADRLKFLKDINEAELKNLRASEQPIFLDRLKAAGEDVMIGTILTVTTAAMGAGGGAVIGTTANAAAAVINAVGIEALAAAALKGVTVGAAIGTGVGVGVGVLGLGFGVYLAVRHLTGHEKIKKD